MLRKAVFVWILIAIALFSGGSPDPAFAQSATVDAYERLVAEAPNAASKAPTLEDYGQHARELSMLSETQLNVDRIRGGGIEILEQIPKFPGEVVERLREVSPTGEAVFFLSIVGWILVFLFLAYLFEWQVYGIRGVGPWFIGLQKPNPQGIVEKLPILVIRAMLGIGGIAISILITGVLAEVFLNTSADVTQKTVLITLVTIAMSRASLITWRMVLSPFLSDYRIPRMSDADAKRLFRWLSATVAFSFMLLAVCYWLVDLGVGVINHHIVVIFASLATVIVNIVMILVNRRAITGAIMAGDDPTEASWMQRISAALWAPLAIAYLIGAFVILVYRILSGEAEVAPLILGAYTVLLAIIVAYGVVAYIIALLLGRKREVAEMRAISRANEAREDAEYRNGLAQKIAGDPSSDDGDEDGGPSGLPDNLPGVVPSGRHKSGMQSFEDLAKRTASIIALLVGLYALIHIWGFGYLLDEDGPMGKYLDVLDICFIGYVLYHAARMWIDTRIEEEGGAEIELEPGDEGGGASSASRLATLLPLLRNFMLFLILGSVILSALLELGVNVAPLFAGAGVVGLAIGFGAQTLIRDILSGAFFLIDDAFRRGEYIDIGSVKGTVEKISVRSFQLRHHLGALHTVPFGEVAHLTNFSRDWVMMKLPLRVTYDTDVEKVRKLVKQLGQELLEHPEEGRKFLQPLKSQGVYKMEDSAMIIRVKFMTRPGDQWTTRKLVYSRIRELFAANGIKFAHREVLVRIPDRDPDSLTHEEREAAAAAAQAATAAADEAAASPRAVGDDR